MEKAEKEEVEEFRKEKVEGSTDDARKKLIMELMEHPIGLDDTFSFHCSQCGQCCKNRDDILLTPFDIYRMAKHLGVRTVDVLEKYTQVYIGETSKIPIVALRMSEDGGECPFLEEKRCSIHSSKPVICALYPLGRVISRDVDSDSQEILYILQHTTCGEKTETHSPREWINASGIEESEEWFRLWQDIVVKMSEKVKVFLEVTPPEAMDSMLSLVVSIVYLNYDTELPVVPQFESNKKLLFDMFAEIERALKDFELL